MADGDDDLELDDALDTDPEDTDADQSQEDDQSDDQGGENVDQDGDDGDEEIDASTQGRRSQQDQRQPSRRDRRIDTLIESGRQKDQQLAQLTQRLDALLQTRSQPQGETREQRNARRATMTPEDRMYDVLAEHTEAWGRERTTLQMGMADQLDKASFDAKAANDKDYARLASAVEAKLEELRKVGQSAPREAVLRWVIGDRMLSKRGSKELRTQRDDAQKRVRKQQTRPAPNGSDVRADRGRQQTRERRLENVQI